jgi:hypothetical protein
MALVDELRVLLGDPTAESFRLMGEDLALLPASCLDAAARAYRADRDRAVAAPLRVRHEAEWSAMLREAHLWLRRYNRSLHGRVQGYLELGRRCRFAYPWPVVAILGICQVMSGLWRSRVYGLLGELAARAGLTALERLADGTDDVLRRTNRGIFADSMPTVLVALRCVDLRAGGDEALAEAILGGPLPPLMDEQSRALARGVYAGLALADAEARFRALADLTRTHFGREQAIFSHHMGTDRAAPVRRLPSALGRRLTEPGRVPAPIIEPSGRGRRVAFRLYRLPAGFDMRDHEARVREFGRAFVDSLTGSLDDYRTAVAYTVARFGRSGEVVDIAYPV